MNKKEVKKILDSLGFNVEFYCDFRKQDSELYYEYSYDSILVATKQDNLPKISITITPIGDIRIYGKRDTTEFVFKGGNPAGELTYYLRKKGEWENNNWFEIGIEEIPNTYDVAYTLDEAIEIVIEMIKNKWWLEQ